MKKSKIKLLIYSFLIMFLFINLTDKLCGFRSPPYTWNEIVDSLPLTTIGCLMVACWFTFLGDSQEIISWLDSRAEKRRKKKSIQKKSDEEISNKYNPPKNPDTNLR